MVELAQYRRELGLLRRLFIDPFAHDFLLGPHLTDEFFKPARQFLERRRRTISLQARMKFLTEVDNTALHIDQCEPQLRRQRIADQVARRREDSVEIVKVQSGSGA